jgi:hypothetical protein
MSLRIGLRVDVSCEQSRRGREEGPTDLIAALASDSG